MSFSNPAGGMLHSCGGPRVLRPQKAYLRADLGSFHRGTKCHHARPLQADADYGYIALSYSQDLASPGDVGYECRLNRGLAAALGGVHCGGPTGQDKVICLGMHVCCRVGDLLLSPAASSSEKHAHPGYDPRGRRDSGTRL